MPREVNISSQQAERSFEEDNSPCVKRTRGASYRSQIIVISDSDSDDDLPTPASLLRFSGSNAAGSGSKSGYRDTVDEIIEISSDSEVEATPTKPPPGKRLSVPVTASTCTGAASSVLASISSLSTTFSQAISLNPDDTVESTEPKPASCTDADNTLGLSTPTESSDTESEKHDESQLFDEGGYHPGILHFTPGSRRPVLIASGSATSTTSISAPGTSDYSQDSYSREDETPSQTSSASNDDPFDDTGRLSSPRLSGETSGKAKAVGYRSRVKENNDEDSAAPETPKPRPRPKPKARAAALAITSSPVSVSPKPTPRNRAKALETMALALFRELNEAVFDGRLPERCPIEWSKKLNTTAGRAHWKRLRGADGTVVGHDARIELSTKVVDCEERVKNTLSHEMCHLAAWIIDSEVKPPHGGAFKRWSDQVMDTRSDITITTCHAYEISYKYEWKCASEECGRTYGRHSKSIDPEKQACGACRGQLVPLFATTPRRNPFQDYLKTHMKDFKAANPNMPHGDVMKRLGEQFRAEKEAAVDEELDNVMAGMTRLAIKQHTDQQ